MRLRPKYTLTLLLIGIVPLTLAMIFVLWQSREQARELALGNAQNQMGVASQALSGFFNSRMSEIAAYTEFPLLKTMDFSKIRPFIISERDRHNGIYEKFILGTPESHFYNTSGGNPDRKYLRTFNDKDPNAKPKSIAKRDYWRATVGDNQNAKKIGFVSNPMISYTTGAKQIVIASTILQGNKVVGMLGGALPWPDMERRLNQLFTDIFSEKKLHKKLFLVSNSGVYWYHWDKHKIVHLKTDVQGKPVLNEMGQKISVSTNILDDENPAFANIGKNIINGQKGVEIFSDSKHGESNYIIYTPIPSTPYSIALVLPETDIFSTVKSLEKLFLYTLIIVLVLVFFLALINSRNISAPILQLNRAAKKVRRGHLELLNIAPRNDEIGELATSFNHMITGLKKEHDSVVKREKEITELNQSLEEKIIKRTSTLEITNRVLEAKIEEYNKTKYQLTQHQDLLQNTGTLAKVGGWQTSTDDNTLHSTSELRRIFNFPEDKMLSIHDLFNQFPDKNREKFSSNYDKAKKTGLPFALDLDTTLNNNERICCRIIGETKRVNGAIIGINGAIQDITELKKVDRLKNEFVSTVSHEIRTPLTSISGSIGLIKNGVVGDIPKGVSELIDLIEKNTTRLLFLINDILDIEKIESGKLEYNFDDVELSSLVEQAIEVNQNYAKRLNSTYIFVETIENIKVHADAQRLLQVLANILSNAAKFSVPDSEIKVGIKKSNENTITIYCEDRGPGISDEFKDKIFEKFTQQDGSTNRKYAGSGLGLSISKAIIEQHNGCIRFDTSDNGTTFYIDLPIITD